MTVNHAVQVTMQIIVRAGDTAVFDAKQQHDDVIALLQGTSKGPYIELCVPGFND